MTPRGPSGCSADAAGDGVWARTGAGGGAPPQAVSPSTRESAIDARATDPLLPQRAPRRLERVERGGQAAIAGALFAAAPAVAGSRFPFSPATRRKNQSVTNRGTSAISIGPIAL